MDAAVSLVAIGNAKGPSPWETYLVLELLEQEQARGGLGPTPLTDPLDSALEFDYATPADERKGEPWHRPTSSRIEQNTHSQVVWEDDGTWTEITELPELPTRDGSRWKEQAAPLPAWWRFEVRTIHGGHGLALVLLHELTKQPMGEEWHEGRPEAYEEQFTRRTIPFEPNEYAELMLWWIFGNGIVVIDLPLDGIVEALVRLREVAEEHLLHFIHRVR